LDNHLQYVYEYIPIPGKDKKYILEVIDYVKNESYFLYYKDKSGDNYIYNHNACPELIKYNNKIFKDEMKNVVRIIKLENILK
jgi:hypothetical protein